MRADAIEQMKLSLIGLLLNLSRTATLRRVYTDTLSWNSGFESHRGLQSGSREIENERMLLSHKSGTSIPSFLLPPSTHADDRVVHVDRTPRSKRKRKLNQPTLWMHKRPFANAIVIN